MIRINGKQIGFIYKNNESIEKIIKNMNVVFERGFTREVTTSSFPFLINGIGKNVEDYRISGNTYQNNTSGKNLFLSLDTPSSRNLATYTKINDNSFSLNYTQDDSYNKSSYARIDFDVTKLKPNTQYTISKKQTINGSNFANGGSLRTYINGVNGSVVNENSITFTTPNGITSLGIYFYLGYENVTKGESTITFYDIQLEEGSTVTNFEPYTGGEPSPSSNYPQELISCGDRTENLYDKNNFVNGYIDASGIFHGDATVLANALSDYIKLDNNTDYIFSAKSTIYGLNVALYDENKNFVRRKIVNNNSKNQFNSETESYCRVWSNINQQTTITSDLIEEYEIQLRKGSTILSYEPYGYKIPVNVRNENLFNKNDTNIINNKYLDIDGSTIDNNNFLITDYIAIKGNTVYNLTPTRPFSACNCFYDENKTFISGIQISSINKTFTTPLNAKFIRLSVRKIDYIDMLMLVEGSTVPSKYIPYYNQTTNIYLNEPLRKSLNNIYIDCIDFANKKIIRRNGISVINVDNIILKSNYTNVEYASSPKPSNFIGYNSYDAQPTFCSHATYLFNPSNYDSKNNVGRFITGPEKNNWWIGFPKGTGLTEIKSKLDGCEFVYILATPTEESITLPDIPLINENNIIDIETVLKPSGVYLKYKSNI